MRNPQGEIVSRVSHFYKHLHDALTSATLAARDVVILAQMLDMYQVILEIKNCTLVALLRFEEGGRCAIAGLQREIRESSRGFRSFDVSFVNREGNEVAQLCASKVLESVPSLSWLAVFQTG